MMKFIKTYLSPHQLVEKKDIKDYILYSALLRANKDINMLIPISAFIELMNRDTNTYYSIQHLLGIKKQYMIHIPEKEFIN